MKERAGLILLGIVALAVVAANLWGMVSAIWCWERIGFVGLLPLVASCCAFNAWLGEFAGDCFDRARKQKEAPSCPPST